MHFNIPFIAGLAVGLWFAGMLGIAGWCLGYEAAMRKTATWLLPTVDNAPDVVTIDSSWGDR